MCFRVALIFLVLTASLGATDRPNFLVLVADDLRPDAIGALGNPVVRTPHLDALASRSLVFTRAFCSYPICVVSRAEMLTGRHAWENGVDGMGGKLRDGQTFWAEALRDAGYETWHVGKWHVSGRPSRRGYTDVAGMFAGGGGKLRKEGQVDRRGFPVTGYTGWIFQSEDGKTQFPEFGAGLSPEISGHFADAALSLIRRGGEKPWFCHVNFTAPHDPLFPAEESSARLQDFEIPIPPNFLPEHPFDHGNFDGRDERLLPRPRTGESVRELLRDYYAVIEDLDRAVGKILTGLVESGEAEDTVVIFTSDHGFAAGSHGLSGKQNQYEHTLRVPLLIAGPGIPSGRTGAMVYLRDLFPTTCDLAGVKIPESVTALSFEEVLKGESECHHEAVFGLFTDTQRTVRTADGWKLIHNPQIDRWQLFDLNTDPYELHDLSVADETALPPQFAILRGKLARWGVEAGDPLLKK